MAKIHDVTVTISAQMPVWPGDPAPVIERKRKIEEGANSNTSQLTLGVHCGTHLDSPFHFIPDGKSVESLPLDVLYGPVLVVALDDTVSVINAEVVHRAALPTGTVRVLFKTRNSTAWAENESTFRTDFVGIDHSGAKLLVEMGICLVGVDYLSVAPYKQSRPTHEEFLKAGVVVVEGLDLSKINGGHYTLCCLPLKLQGSDGAPARVVLVEE